MAEWLFYIIAGVLIITAILVVTLNNLVYAILAFSLFLLSIAAIFLFLHAEFVAIVQVLVLLGGLIILFLFAVMFTPGLMKKEITQKYDIKHRMIATLATMCLLYILLRCLRDSSVFLSSNITFQETMFKDQLKNIGRLLLNVYLLPFELISVVLIATLIGSIAIILKKNGQRN